LYIRNVGKIAFLQNPEEVRDGGKYRRPMG
jgi:hypothetical protein